MSLLSRKKKFLIKKTKIRAANRGSQKDLLIERNQFDKSKSEMSLDYIFGAGVSKNIDFSKISFVHSRKTGRIKQLEDTASGKVLFTFRPNGTIAPTPAGASLLISRKPNPRARWIVTVADGVSEIVSKGKTVFCKHVTSCSDSLRAGEDVVVLNEKRELLAVGRSVISGRAMKQFKRGQAIKIREGVS